MAGGAPVLIPFNPNGFVNFSPYETIGLTVNSGGTSSSGVFVTNLSINANSVQVFNDTTKTVFIAFGNSANAPITAVLPTNISSNNSTPIGAGAIHIFTKLGSTAGNNATQTAAAAITAGAYDTVAVLPGAAAGTVYFTAGEGA